MKDEKDKNMDKVVKKIDGICSECSKSQIGVEIGEKLKDRTIICGECGTVIECPICDSRNIGYFESVWICGDCTHHFNRYPKRKNNNII